MLAIKILISDYLHSDTFDLNTRLEVMNKLITTHNSRYIKQRI